MHRKWQVIALSALILVGGACGLSLSQAQEKKESKLEGLMEKINKHNSVIQKGTRNQASFKRSHKDIGKSAKELVKLAKEAKPFKEDAVKKAKVANAEKLWDSYFDAFIKSSEELESVATASDATYDKTKAAFQAVKKSCADCHKDFRVEDEF